MIANIHQANRCGYCKQQMDPAHPGEHVNGICTRRFKGFAWVRDLPDHEIRAFITELADPQNPDREATIAGWRATAEAYADPAVLTALTGPLGDYGQVPEPGTGWEEAGS